MFEFLSPENLPGVTIPPINPIFLSSEVQRDDLDFHSPPPQGNQILATVRTEEIQRDNKILNELISGLDVLPFVPSPFFLEEEWKLNPAGYYKANSLYSDYYWIPGSKKLILIDEDRYFVYNFNGLKDDNDNYDRIQLLEKLPHEDELKCKNPFGAIVLIQMKVKHVVETEVEEDGQHVLIAKIDLADINICTEYLIKKRGKYLFAEEMVFSGDIQRIFVCHEDNFITSKKYKGKVILQIKNSLFVFIE
eukprot:GHVP01063721.1.p1 GENE.GHVP01063721.1~~GHVP01063721.1.p1  ORF type:complete len:259 (+),score=38.52 GHVP01063721.1:32-778(+)